MRICGLDRAAGRRPQPRERAGATPVFGAFGDPRGDPGAGVAPARVHHLGAFVRDQKNARLVFVWTAEITASRSSSCADILAL